MEEIIVVLFYKYVQIEKPEVFRKKHAKFCNELGIRGRILVAEEGINGSVSGNKEQIEEYKNNILADKRFADMVFKESKGIMHPFHKMIVKTKREIVNFGQKVDLSNSGKHLSPKEFIELCKEEETVVLDARNNYESKMGRFEGAVCPDIKTFREFPKVLDVLKGKEKKKIAMYCTGGIRCEKASAYLKERGFEEVYQLDGGILNFGKEFPDTIWEGKCFVFDKRTLEAVNSEEGAITNCEICGTKCDLYKNCARNECDKYCIVCLDCERNFGGCCSEECFSILQEDNKIKVREQTLIVNLSA